MSKGQAPYRSQETTLVKLEGTIAGLSEESKHLLGKIEALNARAFRLEALLALVIGVLGLLIGGDW